MKIKLFRGVVAALLILGIIFTVISCSRGENKIEVGKGAHGGRLLQQGNIGVEMTIYEKGMPPHFRVYLYQNNKLLSPNSGQLTVQLKRFSGEVDAITFQPTENFLQSREIIHEPHSFDVTVLLNLENHTYNWRYSSYEGRITLSPEVIRTAEIKTAVAEPTTINEQLAVTGKIVPNRDTLAPIYPRYAGIVRELRKNLGDAVEKGETIAIVESNDSLQSYSITSPITGTVVQKFVTIGEIVKDNNPIYEIANLDTVWADLTIYRRDANLVRVNMPVKIIGDGAINEQSTIHFISPLGITDSQTLLARVLLSNTERKWLPGMYINGVITITSKSVPLAVNIDALQRWRDWNVVFIKQGNTFEAVPVELGARDKQNVEISSGLKPGQVYVTENSFLLKADLGKSSASHDH